ncbi:MAG: hypothetical protein INQ03_24820 [Candidatus Heimdallarchaeota archaeon]|nr:hypothetical protein [Candidatus Heimdallarchaeota archaeon]
MKRIWLAIVLIFLIAPLLTSQLTNQSSEQMYTDAVDPTIEIYDDSFIWEENYDEGLIESVFFKIDVYFSESIMYIPVIFFTDENVTVDVIMNDLLHYQNRFLSVKFFTSSVGINGVNETFSADRFYNLGLQQNVSIVLGIVYNLNGDTENYSYQASGVLLEKEYDYTKYKPGKAFFIDQSFEVAYYNSSGSLTEREDIDVIQISYQINVTEEVRAYTYANAFLFEKGSLSYPIPLDCAYIAEGEIESEPGNYTFTENFSLMNLDLLDPEINYTMYIEIYLDFPQDEFYYSTYKSFIVDEDLTKNNFALMNIEYSITQENLIFEGDYAKTAELTLDTNATQNIMLNHISVQSWDDPSNYPGADYLWISKSYYQETTNGSQEIIFVPFYHPYFSTGKTYDLVISISFRYEKMDSTFSTQYEIEYTLDLSDISLIGPIFSDFSLDYTTEDVNGEPGIDFINVTGTFEWNMDPSQFESVQFGYGYNLIHPEFGRFGSSMGGNEILLYPLQEGQNEFNYYLFGADLYSYQIWNSFFDYSNSYYEFGIDVQVKYTDDWIFFIEEYKPSDIVLADVDPNVDYFPWMMQSTTIWTTDDYWSDEVSTETYIDYIPSNQGWFDYGLFAFIPIAFLPLLSRRLKSK